MRHKKKRYLPWKCGPPRSKSYCATRRNATKRGQFCPFGLFAGHLVGSPPHKLPKMVRLPNLPYKEFSSAGTASILEFLAFLGLHCCCFWSPARTQKKARTGPDGTGRFIHVPFEISYQVVEQPSFLMLIRSRIAKFFTV